MFGRGAKIVVSVRPVPTDHPQGPISARNTNSLRFIFRNGGEEDVSFFKYFAVLMIINHLISPPYLNS